MGIEQIIPSWRADLRAIRESIEYEAGGDIPSNYITTDMLQDLSVTEPKLADLAVTNSKLGPKAVTADKLADNAITTPLIATVCPATTVNFAFSEDGSTFSFTGGTFLYLSAKNNFGVVTLGAAINVPYVTGRVLVMDVSNPDAPNITSRSISPSMTFADNEYVIGNFFNFNTSPITQTATVYGSGAYTWSATAGHHEAYGDISTTGATLDLTVGNFIVRATGGANANISILSATNTSIPNIDIRRFSIYGDSSEGAAFDDVTVTSTPLIVDDTVLKQSNDTCTIWIGNGRQVIEVKVFISANGTRCRILSDFLSQ